MLSWVRLHNWSILSFNKNLIIVGRKWVWTYPSNRRAQSEIHCACSPPADIKRQPFTRRTGEQGQGEEISLSDTSTITSYQSNLPQVWVFFRWPNFQALQQMVVPMAKSFSDNRACRYKWLIIALGILRHIQPQADTRTTFQSGDAGKQVDKSGNSWLYCRLPQRLSSGTRQASGQIDRGPPSFCWSILQCQTKRPVWNVEVNQMAVSPKAQRERDSQAETAGERGWGGQDHEAPQSSIRSNDNLQITHWRIFMETLSFWLIRDLNEVGQLTESDIFTGTLWPVYFQSTWWSFQQEIIKKPHESQGKGSQATFKALKISEDCWLFDFALVKFSIFYIEKCMLFTVRQRLW